MARKPKAEAPLPRRAYPKDGGSYTRDKSTGELRRRDETLAADLAPPADKEA